MKYLLLLIFPTLAFAQTPITSIWFVTSGSRSASASIAEVDTTGNVIQSQALGFTALQSPIVVTFPATATDVTVGSVVLTYTVNGSGFSVPPIPITVPCVPNPIVKAGGTLVVTYTAPMTSDGTIQCAATAPPPPPVVTPPPTQTATPSPSGSCTAPAAVTGCSAPLAQLIDSTGGAWTLVKGVPNLNGKPTNNVYAPNIRYLFVVPNGSSTQIRSQNSNGTYACWTGTAWGC